MSRYAPAIPLADILEKDFQATVIDLAKQLGWKRIYHTYNSRRSAHGFPDLVLIRDRVLFLELKRESGRCTDEQKAWLRDLRDAGAEVYVCRPSDLAQLAEVLAARVGSTRPQIRGAVLNVQLDRELERSTTAA